MPSLLISFQCKHNFKAIYKWKLYMRVRTYRLTEVRLLLMSFVYYYYIIKIDQRIWNKKKFGSFILTKEISNTLSISL